MIDNVFSAFHVECILWEFFFLRHVKNRVLLGLLGTNSAILTSYDAS